MPQVPKKNISNRISDIMRPGDISRRQETPQRMKTEQLSRFSATSNNAGSMQARGSRRKFSIVKFSLIFVAAVMMIGGVMISYGYHAERIKISHIKEELGPLSDFFGISGASNDLPAAASEDPSAIGNLPTGGGMGQFISFIKSFGSNIRSFQTISGQALELISQLKALQSTALAEALNKNGDAIVTRLARMQELIHSVSTAASDLQDDASFLSAFLPINSTSLFSAQVDLDHATAFMDELVAWMKEDATHHIVVILENPSEIRPGGGFQGSYIEMSMRKGSIEAIDAHDISEPDRVLDAKIMPPVPLQALVKRFRAADANWFFDFPTSASTTLSLLEASNLYKDKNIRFDAAIGISGNAVRDILKITGPLKLSDGTSVTSDNVFDILQQNVQEGHDVGSTDAKAIIKESATKLLSAIATLPSEKQSELTSAIVPWVNNRDLRIYAKNPVFESFIARYGAAGDTFVIPENYNGDYLAVVQANIGGGKSDRFMQQDVVMQSQIQENSTVSTHLTVSRTHAAPEDAPWWHTMTNQTYTQVLTTPSAVLTYADGGFSKTIKTPVDYAKEGFALDPVVRAMQATEEESAEYSSIKTFRYGTEQAFATWVSTKRGETSELNLVYTTRLAEQIRSGMEYHFTFDKQSGVNGSYTFQVSAPVGYVFAENNLPVYEYTGSEPGGRMSFTLTLRTLSEN